MADKLNVLTCAGSATGAAVSTLHKLGAEVRLAKSVRDAYSLPMDRLLLLGGSDILPFWYGEPDRHCGPFDKERDLIEWAMLRRAMNEEKPIFGICRGHQFLAAAFGGALYQDIRLDGGIPHIQATHGLVEVKEPLASLLPTLTVNSYHHQAIMQLPLGFDTLAWSPDGVVEAIWYPRYLGVQFHPEMLVGAEPRWESLFQWFLNGLEAKHLPPPVATTPDIEAAERDGDAIPLGEVIIPG